MWFIILPMTHMVMCILDPSSQVTTFCFLYWVVDFLYDVILLIIFGRSALH